MAQPEITITFRRETDGRWTAFIKRWKLSITRNSLDQVRWNIWEWLVERLDVGGLEGIDEDLADELQSLRTVGRVEDPWVGLKIDGSEKYIPATASVDAVQWTGGNLPEVIRYVSHTIGLAVIPASPRYLILESTKGKSGIDSSDWIIRDSDNNISLMSDKDFRRLFVPLPPIIVEAPVKDDLKEPEDTIRKSIGWRTS